MKDLSKYQTALDIPTQEFEDMILEAHSDIDITSAFIEANQDDFDEYCYEHGIHHDYAMDHEMDYMESRDEAFFEFVFNWHKRGSK